MTTAHRPTFNPARGTTGDGFAVSQGGYFTGGAVSTAVSVRQLPSQTKLKFRELGQTTSTEVAQRDLRRELEERERKHFEEMRKERDRKRGFAPGAAASAALLTDIKSDRRKPESDSGSGAASSASAPAAATAPSVTDLLAGFDDRDDDALDRVAVPSSARAGAGTHGNAADDDDDDGDDEDEDDSEDDMAEVMAELERIKREREEEKARKLREAEELARKEETEAILRGNPLMSAGGGVSAHGSGSAALKRKFGDDTVFSNTHAAEPEAKRRFINDVIRSDFHRQFLKRFVQ